MGPGSTSRWPLSLPPDRASEDNSVEIAVIGAGHVGLVTAVCLAAVGHEVLAVSMVLLSVTRR